MSRSWVVWVWGLLLHILRRQEDVARLSAYLQVYGSRFAVRPLDDGAEPGGKLPVCLWGLKHTDMGIKQKNERFVQDHFYNDFVCEPPIMGEDQLWCWEMREMFSGSPQLMLTSGLVWTTWACRVSSRGQTNNGCRSPTGLQGNQTTMAASRRTVWRSCTRWRQPGTQPLWQHLPRRFFHHSLPVVSTYVFAVFLPQTGRWNDAACTILNGYVCKMAKGHYPPPSVAPTQYGCPPVSKSNTTQSNSKHCDAFFFFLHFTAVCVCVCQGWDAYHYSCYWVEETARTWHEAKEFCAAQDSFLVHVGDMWVPFYSC